MCTLLYVVNQGCHKTPQAVACYRNTGISGLCCDGYLAAQSVHESRQGFGCISYGLTILIFSLETRTFEPVQHFLLSQSGCDFRCIYDRITVDHLFELNCISPQDGCIEYLLITVAGAAVPCRNILNRS